MLLLVLLILLFVAFGGGYRYRGAGYVSWSPVGLLILLALILYFTGNLHL